ncbi:putative angiotensin-converting enzyme 2 [Helianthus annuus]|uniref:Angiotensin-converting enzyme 2 n=1 Tax=Helianthus annuus TaxID=4232 RepID=A0A9K3H294_HELAN|nr:putative angiotensin-converting enzyme 2 [Helianthus annuus]
MPEVPVASFTGEESNAKTVNEPIVDPDALSFGFLGQIPRNFSLSHLTADFNISSEWLESKYAKVALWGGDELGS